MGNSNELHILNHLPGLDGPSINSSKTVIVWGVYQSCTKYKMQNLNSTVVSL